MKSLLFVPATRPDRVAKTPRSGPGGVVVDLEDAVPPDAKADTRPLARQAAAALVAEHPGLPVFLRVNAVPTEWFAADLTEGAAPGLAGVVVPKLESPEQVPDRPTMAGIETALGVERAIEILGHPQVQWCYFGAEDFVADMGGVRRSDSVEVLYARSRLALAARIAGVHAFDQIVTDVRDEAVFRADADVGRAIGYRGKLCIHPDQVRWANAAFSPSTEEVARARRVLEAYDAAAAAGHAAIEVDGQMIDEPLARQARAILAAAPEHE